MENERIIDRFGDQNGDLARWGITKNGKFYVEQINEAFSPNPGRISRSYFPTKKAARTEFENLELYYVEPIPC